MNESCIGRAKTVLTSRSQRSGGRVPPATAVLEKASWATWAVVDMSVEIKTKHIEEKDDKYERRKDAIAKQVSDGFNEPPPIKLAKHIQIKII